MSVSRTSHTATLLPNGNVLVTGGNGASTEQYNPSANTWSPAASMSITRSDHTATLLSNGKVLENGGNTSLAAELYDPATNTWSSAGNMSTARFEHTATLISSGKVLVARAVGKPRHLSSASLRLEHRGVVRPCGQYLEPYRQLKRRALFPYGHAASWRQSGHCGGAA